MDFCSFLAVPKNVSQVQNVCDIWADIVQGSVTGVYRTRLDDSIHTPANKGQAPVTRELPLKLTADVFFRPQNTKEKDVYSNCQMSRIQTISSLVFKM